MSAENPKLSCSVIVTEADRLRASDWLRRWGLSAGTATGQGACADDLALQFAAARETKLVWRPSLGEILRRSEDAKLPWSINVVPQILDATGYAVHQSDLPKMNYMLHAANGAPVLARALMEVGEWGFRSSWLTLMNRYGIAWGDVERTP